MPQNLLRCLEEVECVVIHQRAIDGYVNATHLARAHKTKTGERKDPNDWIKTGPAKAAARKLSEVTGIPPEKLVETKRGGKNPGTWIHPRLSVRFTMWLNDDFSLQVEDWIHQWIATEQNPVQMTMNELNYLDDMVDKALTAAKLVHTAIHGAVYILKNTGQQLKQIRESQTVRRLDSDAYREYSLKADRIEKKIGELSKELGQIGLPEEAFEELEDSDDFPDEKSSENS